MNTTFDILVIALSALLGILLILLIIVVVKIKKLVQAIEHVVSKGEQVVLSAEAATEIFKNAAGPVGTVKTIMNLFESLNNRKRKD